MNNPLLHVNQLFYREFAKAEKKTAFRAEITLSTGRQFVDHVNARSIDEADAIFRGSHPLAVRVDVERL